MQLLVRVGGEGEKEREREEERERERGREGERELTNQHVMTERRLLVMSKSAVEGHLLTFLR